jgi:hypothetical protein
MSTENTEFNATKAKHIAMVVNSIQGEITRSELTNLMRSKKCMFYSYISSHTEKFATMTRKTDKGVRILNINKPVHYGVFLSLINEARVSSRNIKRKKGSHTEAPLVVNPLRPTSPKHPKENNFSVFSDAEIAAELRHRGYDVIAKKIIEL